MITIGKRFIFEAAHFIEDHPTCGKLHGHSWTLEVMIKGEVGDLVYAPPGMLIDFKVLGGAVRTVTNWLDHKTINDVVDIPVITAETLVQWFTTQIRKTLAIVDESDNWNFIIIGCRLKEGIDGGWAEYWEGE